MLKSHTKRIQQLSYSALATIVILSILPFLVRAAVQRIRFLINVHAKASNASIYISCELYAADGLSFSPSTSEPVAMCIDYSLHYQFDLDEGAQEFVKLTPLGGHLVHVGGDATSLQPVAYMVTMFHQLKCLDVI
ncbi:uncharacterized protein LAESUDRAFT_717257 [Laetiporus sulphureus 93-53]|uniref:Uncharacterized protein n=1 Tax=Laetiporus sulphureus 93-53 TaxID=1314785 RepID=A0A165BWA7_9APHY|nr:uncharacterized protein LAESUDRAFT_717257 [Laetiporus sulphureus 93-53]KZT01768.1 hypothetical protein LAESUDRAFT_717257 [Laetiporus sulphureus 93-53]